MTTSRQLAESCEMTTSPRLWDFSHHQLYRLLVSSAGVGPSVCSLSDMYGHQVACQWEKVAKLQSFAVAAKLQILTIVCHSRHLIIGGVPLCSVTHFE